MVQKTWVTPKEVAKITGKSLSTIYEYVKKGYLDSRRVGKNTKPLYIDYYSIPTFLRQRKEHEESK